LAQAGAHVVVAGRSRERGQERVNAIAALGGAASYEEVDVTARQSLEAYRNCVRKAPNHPRVGECKQRAGITD
jgi:NAD(P)-dependent dehydrogenase (short-subunit alcohol dehydrogenase family)